MQRILVTGNAGAGKTTLARALAAHLGLPYAGLDRIVWRPGWQPTPTPERRAMEASLASGERWVVDGVSDLILHAADTVVFLDYSRRQCFWRVLRRNLPYLFRSRPDLPERCPEILIVRTLVRIIWRFPARVRPRILESCRSANTRMIHIRSDSELLAFLNSVGLSGASVGQADPSRPIRGVTL